MTAKKELVFDIFGRDRTASRAMKGVGDAGDNMARSLKTAAFAAGAALATIGVVALRVGTDAVQAYAQAEQSQNRLQFATEKFPALADTNIRQLQNLNSALQAKTRFDDDAIASAQAVLAQYDLTGAQLKELTPLLLDYASVTGKDVPSAAEDLGTALLGQARTLKKVGIDFDDAGSVAANYDQIIQGLGRTVSGFAERDAETLSGTLDRIKNRFEDSQEALGEALSPIADFALDAIDGSLLPALERATNKLGSEGIEGALDTLAPKVDEFFDKFADAAVDTLPDVVKALEGILAVTNTIMDLNTDPGKVLFGTEGATDVPLLDPEFQAMVAADPEAAANDYYGLLAEYEAKKYAESMRAQAGLLYDAGQELSAQALQGAADKLNEGAANAGDMFVFGMAQGISRSEWLALQAAENVAMRVIEKTNNTLQVRSPSRKGMKTGGYWTRGIAIGMLDEAPRIDLAVREIADRMAFGYDNSFRADASWAADIASASSSRAAGPSSPSPAVEVHLHFNGGVMADPNAIARTVDSAFRKAVKDGTLPREWYSRR